MGRSYSYGYTNWKEYHGTKRQAVSAMYGGLDADVLEVFLNLDLAKLNEVFRNYARQYSSSSAAYAKRTYSKWQNGDVKPSGQTLERLVLLLPPLLSFDVKCELLRKLRERHRQRENHELKVDVVNWAEVIAPLVARIVGKAYTATLPEVVERRLEWLTSGDMQAARALLTEAEVREGKNAIALLRHEFHNIERLLLSLPTKGKIIHTIELPYGRIKLSIRRNNRMANDENKLVQKNQSLFRPTAEDILDNAFENLSAEQAQEINAQAAKEALRIYTDKKRSEHKFENAKKDMTNFIQNANELDQASRGRDYSMKGSFESASGTTNVEISRRTLQTAITIAVVVGLILLVFFLFKH